MCYARHVRPYQDIPYGVFYLPYNTTYDTLSPCALYMSIAYSSAHTIVQDYSMIMYILHMILQFLDFPIEWKQE